jgi:hypothetical protein
MWATKKLEWSSKPSWQIFLDIEPIPSALREIGTVCKLWQVGPSCKMTILPSLPFNHISHGKKRTTMSISVRGGRTLGEGRLAGCRVQGAGRGSKPDWLQTGEWFNSSRSWLLVLRSAELRLILSSLHLCFLFICSMDANSSFHLEIRIVTPNCRCGGWFVAWTKSWIRKSPTS